MIEQWKRIYLNGNQTDYYISNLGNVKDIDNNAIHLKILQDVMNDKLPKYYCDLRVGPKDNTVRVDKLVADAFLKNPTNSPASIIFPS